MEALCLLEVTKYYSSVGDVVRVLDGASLTVAPGEFVAMYGPSGTGKTTMLLLAAAIVLPDKGQITFGGRRVDNLSPRQAARYRRENLGLVFQSFHLIEHASALDNASLKLLSLGMTPTQARAIARPWLERVGLSHRLHHTAATMSSGERQRVAVARALAGTPRLLLADEPTGNLDASRSKDIIALLAEIGRETQIPVLLATHDPQATSSADTIYSLNDGRVNPGLSIDLRHDTT